MPLNRCMGNLFDAEPFTSFGPGIKFRNWENDIQTFKPPTDISETDKTIIIRSNLPGIKKKDIKIDLDDLNRVLTFYGARSDKRDDNEVYHRVDRSYGKFSRSIELPKNADFDNIRANMEDGVLNISIPKKKKQTKTRAINIQ